MNVCKDPSESIHLEFSIFPKLYLLRRRKKPSFLIILTGSPRPSQAGLVFIIIFILVDFYAGMSILIELETHYFFIFFFNLFGVYKF